MANIQIPNLPAATGLGGSEQFEGVQSGTSVRITASQIAAYISAAYPAPGIASVSGSAPISVSTVGSAATVSLNLQGVTNAYMATMAAGTVKANVTVGSASPTDATPSQVLDVIGSGGGSLLYRGASSWAALSAGTAGQFLVSGGTGAPSWQTLSVPSGNIAPTGVVAGTYGSASTSPQYTVLASGQLSAASNVPIVIPSTSVTGLGTMATQNANTVAITGGTMDGVTIGGVTPAAASFAALTATGPSNFATIQSGTWNGSPIAVLYGGTGATAASGARANLGAAASGANSDITSLSGLTTPLSAPQGGTGFGSYTTGDILYADTSSTLARLNDVATGNALISGGVGVAPSWGKIGLTTHVSGTLPVANGGSGATTLTGFLKGNGTSAFTAQATIGNADLTNSSLTVGSTTISLGGTATTLAGLTTVTLTQDPTAALEAATKQYVDNEVLSVSNTTFHTQCGYATTADLGSVTYSNGTGGVGATITQSGSPSVLIIDGYTFTASDVTNATRVLVKNQSSGLQNGIYTVANEGSGAANWQLIRATDFNTVGTGPNRVQTGASTFVTGGAANGSTGWVMNVDGTIIIGTTALVWVQSSSSSSVTVTSPLTKVGSVISLGTVPATLGGTGLTTLTQYGVMLGNGTGNVAFASPSTSGLPLLSTGASSNPAFGQLSLTAGVTGTLPVANGGTGTATALTAGSVVFAGASGVYSQNNAEFFWNNTNDFLGLGTASPDTRLTITAPTQTAVTAGTLPAGTDLHIVGADSAITRITQDAFGTGNYPAYTGRAARGTAASPTATQSGDVLSQYGGRGRGATDYSSTSVARIDLEAAENFTDTAQGSFISLHTTALGAASPVERFRAGPAGQWGIGGATYGTSGQVFTSGGASAAPSWTTLSATSLTGVLPVANGGTNISSYTVGDLLYADGTTSLAKLADVATGNALISGGIGVAPSYGKIGLATHVSGTLPIGNGGTGVTGTPVNGELLIGNGTGYSLGTLTASTGISVTNGSGSITIANTGVTSLIAGTAISVSAATGGVTVNNTGVTSLTAGTNITVSASTGGVTIGTTATPSWTSETVPLISGGTTSSSTLTLQSTSGSGTSDAIIFRTASQTERMRIDTSGNIGIGGSPSSGATLTVAKPVTGATDGYNIDITGVIQSDIVTAYGVRAAIGTAAASFTLPNMYIFSAGQGSFGAGSSVTNQYGFFAGSSLTGASTNYGFYSNLAASGTSRWGFYANGTAPNFFNGQVQLGAGTVSAPALSTTGDTNTGIFFPAADTIAFAEGGVESMRIDSSGNVGIGTGSPQVRLHVVSADGVTNSRFAGASYAVRIQSVAATGAVIDATNNTEASYQPLLIGGSQVQFTISGAEQMRLASSGNFGIGNTSPATRLDVTGPASVTSFTGSTRLGVTVRGSTGATDFSGIDFIGNSQTNPIGRIALLSGGSGSVLYFGTSNSYGSGITVAAMTLDQTGNLVAAGNVTAYSDARLKKNVSTIDNALALVEKMRGVRYERIEDGKAGVGVIAQDMQEVVPEVVHEGENLSVAYGNLVGVLIEAVKELSARVKELEAK
jgi:hypothetical protein